MVSNIACNSITSTQDINFAPCTFQVAVASTNVQFIKSVLRSAGVSTDTIKSLGLTGTTVSATFMEKIAYTIKDAINQFSSVFYAPTILNSDLFDSSLKNLTGVKNGTMTSAPGTCDDHGLYSLEDILSITTNFYGVKPNSTLIESFTTQAYNQTKALPYSIPNITHHLWLGDSAISSDSLIMANFTSSKFDSSWTHYIWTNNVTKVDVTDFPHLTVKALSSLDDSSGAVTLIDKLVKNLLTDFAYTLASNVVLQQKGGLYLQDYVLCKSANDATFLNQYDFAGIQGYNLKAVKPYHPIINDVVKQTMSNLDCSTAKPQYLKSSCNLESYKALAADYLPFVLSFLNNAFSNKNVDLAVLDVYKNYTGDSASIFMSSTPSWNALNDYCTTNPNIVGSYTHDTAHIIDHTPDDFSGALGDFANCV